MHPVSKDRQAACESQGRMASRDGLKRSACLHDRSFVPEVADRSTNKWIGRFFLGDGQ